MHATEESLERNVCKNLNQICFYFRDRSLVSHVINTRSVKEDGRYACRQREFLCVSVYLKTLIYDILIFSLKDTIA